MRRAVTQAASQHDASIGAPYAFTLCALIRTLLHMLRAVGHPMNQPNWIQEHLVSGHEVRQRYELVEEIGAGGFGVVWRAKDTASRRDVAIKFFFLEHGEQAADAWREASMLRRIGLLAGARLLDEGLHEQIPFMVMQYVEGHPFPGPSESGAPPDGECLIRLADALLEELGQLHKAGVFHGDLKPNNVLIERDSGEVVLLDYGLSRMLSGSLATDRAATVRRRGTPLYMSPEQLRAQEPSVASDLYSVGVMLFEAAAGRAPHETSSLTELMRARLMRPAPALNEVAPETPEVLVELVERLLKREVGERPESTEEARRMLGHSSAPAFAQDVSAQPLQRSLERIERGESLRLGTRAGIRLERLLDEIEQELLARGYEVQRLAEGEAPMESLRPLMEDSDLPAFKDWEACRAFWRERICVEDISRVLIIASSELLDPWSQRLIEQVREEVTILEVVEGPGDLAVAPMMLDDLMEVFEGPEIGFHLKSDPAKELLLRTGGRIDAVTRELGAWHGRGFVWQGECGLRCERDTVDWLAQHGYPIAAMPGYEMTGASFEDALRWLALVGGRAPVEALHSLLGVQTWQAEAIVEEAAHRHLLTVVDGEAMLVVGVERDALDDSRRRLLLDRLPQGSLVRLRVLLELDDEQALFDEAMRVARKLDLRGDITGAITALREAITVLRQREQHEPVVQLLIRQAELALTSTYTERIETLIVDLQQVRDARLEPILELARLARSTSRNLDESLIEEIMALPELPTRMLELRRRSFAMRLVVHGVGGSKATEVMDRIKAWGEQFDDSEISSTVEGWLAHLAFQQRDFERAARLHTRAAKRKERLSARISSYINLTWTHIAIGNIEKSYEIINDAAELARACRHHSYETQSVQLRRWVQYQLEWELEPNDDLLSAVQLLGNIEFEGRTYVLEAHIAWRSGHLAQAQRYARRALECWHNVEYRAPSLFAEVFLAFLDHLIGKEPPTAESIRRLYSELDSSFDDDMRIQCFGLLSAIEPLSEEQLRYVKTFAKSLDRGDLCRRRELISIEEALEFAGIRLDEEE